MVVTLSQIYKGNRYLLRKAETSYFYKKYIKSIDYIKRYARLSYLINGHYANYDLEDLIKKISYRVFSPVEISNPIDNRILWIDYWGWEKRGLTTQYIDALIANGKKIMFVLTDDSDINSANNNLEKIRRDSENKLIILNKNDEIFKIMQDLLEEIKLFSPSKLFLHIAPWDIEALLITNSIKGIPKYNINLTDHAFWVGASFIDYNIEFRNYGATVSLEKRGLKPENLILLPYYPIINDNHEFQGFPCEFDNNDVIIFTGGSSYKYKGKNDIFCRMLETLLEIDKRVKILIAGFSHDSYIEDRIAKLQNKDRVHIIGVRNDIDKVFDKCDIYLGSYPFGGGLMSCYAASFSKPILAYTDPDDIGNHLEGLLNIFEDSYRTTETLDEFRNYAQRLITDPLYRKSEGEKICRSAMTKEKFNEILGSILRVNRSPLVFSSMDINYDEFRDQNLVRENSDIKRFFSFLFHLFSLRVFFLFPQFIFMIPYFIMEKIFQKFKSYC